MTPQAASALSRDTSAEAEKAQIRALRELPPWRKVELVEDANRTARMLALTGLRARFPEASREELARGLMDLVLGEELAARVYGPAEGRNDPARP